MKRRLCAALAALVVLLVACSKVTPENFDKIQDGMTEQQVLAILGQPSESNSVTVLGLSGTSSVWRGGGSEITIQFVNGKVALKRFERPAGG